MVFSLDANELKLKTTSFSKNSNTDMDIENRLVVAKGEGRGNGIDWEFGVRGCKLLHLEWISNVVLLYSTGNSIQSLGIEHEDNMRKRVYIYV